MKKNIFLLIIIISIISCISHKNEIETPAYYENIRLNQLGYYPGSVKQFMLVDTDADSFSIIDEYNQTVFEGKLIDQGFWILSGEKVLMGEFSLLKKAGNYSIVINDSLQSYPFEVKEGLYQQVLNAVAKSYYFQRASMPIEKQYGGKYNRAAGHPDDSCFYHPSTGRSSGYLNSKGGWYDAGDYGKYIVNASLSVGQMLLLLEQYPQIIADGELNIPESGNGIGDLWDELKYELCWILTMQDTDGGVYHKLTAKNFSGFVMPEDDEHERWVIGKGTAASLNFSAVLAQASRLYNKIDPVWSSLALDASQKAFKWALKNDSIPFSNPEDISTGAYDDIYFDDDFYWAAAELYLATKNVAYLGYVYGYQQPYIHELTNSWKFFVRNNGFHSLLQNHDLLEENYASVLQKHHLKLADQILMEISEHPYQIALNQFEWGSNSDILNQAVILCMAHRLTGEKKYLRGAEQITDYIFGKNAVGYCFVTGFGFKKAMNIHHRPSGADGIDEPVPGFVVGGPNADKQDQSSAKYTSVFPAQSYMDIEESYASNEVCLNWNAPAVYVLGYLEMNRNK